MDDLGVHPAGHASDPPDFSSLLVTEAGNDELFISEQHMMFCVAVAAACVLVPLVTAQALKLFRPTLRTPPPPLATLNGQHAATPYKQLPMQQQQQQQQPGAPTTPYSRSVLVYSTKAGSTGATPASPPLHTPTPAPAPIPLLTEVNQPSAAAPASSAWTVSKKDVMQRRGKLGSQQQQPGQGGVQTQVPAGAATATPAAQKLRVNAGAAAAAGLTASSAGAAVTRAIRSAAGSFQARSQQALSGGRTALHMLAALRPWRAQQQDEAQEQDVASPPAPTGWSAELLSQSAQHQGAICSLEGLQASTEYRQWRASQKVHLEDQVQQRLGAYQALRRADPEAFSKLLSRPVVVDYDSVPPSRLLLVLEYIISLCITTATLALALAPTFPPECGIELPFATAPPALRATPLLLWLLLQWGAWAKGYSSFLGSLAGLYCVYEDAQYGEHLRVASTMQILLASLAESVFLGATLLLPGAVYSVSRLCQPSNRAPFGQAAMRLQMVTERRRQVSISQYPPSSPSDEQLYSTLPHLGQDAAEATPAPPSTSSLRQLGGLLAAAGATVGRSLGSRGGRAEAAAAVVPGTADGSSGGFGSGYGGAISFSWGAMYSGGTVPGTGRASAVASGGYPGLGSAEKVEGRGALFQGSATNTPGSLW